MHTSVLYDMRNNNILSLIYISVLLALFLIVGQRMAKEPLKTEHMVLSMHTQHCTH